MSHANPPFTVEGHRQLLERRGQERPPGLAGELLDPAVILIRAPARPGRSPAGAERQPWWLAARQRVQTMASSPCPLRRTRRIYRSSLLLIAALIWLR
jgi:hypothetical protein